jgi:pectate lyase
MATEDTYDLLIEAVAQHVDTVFERGADRYGAQHTPLLVDGLNMDTDTPARWEKHVLSNPACQQNFLRAAAGLTALTGEGRHQQQAEAWTRCALDCMQDPASDLLYWGGHSSYDLETNAPVRGNHEMKCVYPYYEFMHQVNPQRTRRFVEALWHCHVSDWTTLLFNRHGEYETWDRSRCWRAAEFAGGDLPIIENSLLSFINTGSDLICAAVLLHHLEGNEAPLQWARHLVSRYEQIRHPDTGLAGYQFNHREPCRVRQAFKSPLGDRRDVNEMTVIKQGGIRTRYGTAAIAFLNLVHTLGTDATADLQNLVRRDLTALAQHAYDPEDQSFHALLTDGTHLKPDDVVAGAGYCQPDGLVKLPANGLMFLSYAQAYRVLQHEPFLEMALAMARGMGWQPGGDASIVSTPEFVVEGWRLPGQDDVSTLLAWLQLYYGSGDRSYLEMAVDTGTRLLKSRCRDGFLTTGTGPAGPATSIDSALPLGLLHLAAALQDSDCALPAYYPNLSYFDAKVVVAHRSR